MLSWSLRVGSLFGVPVYLHWTFLLLIALFMAAPIVAGTPDAVAMGLRTAAFILAIFGCVLLHELGHALAARRYGIRTRDITLLPIGGVARLERMPDDPVQELVVALAGPAVNVVIAAIVIPLVLMTDGTTAFTGAASETATNASESAASGTRGVVALYHTNFLAALGAVNVFLVLFNMIPALPMDGGRVLRAVLAMAMDRGRATAIAAVLGQLFAVLFGIAGLMIGNFLLIIIAFFVFIAAAAEAQHEQFRSALGGLAARTAMLVHFRALRRSQSLREAATELLAGSQQDSPVLEDHASADDAESLIGVLTRSDLVRAIAEGRLDESVETAMVPDCPTVTEDDDLQPALERIRAAATGRSGPSPVITVVRSDAAGRRRIVGLITADNVLELVMLRTAAQRSRSGA